jgi:hypothetical protein
MSAIINFAIDITDKALDCDGGATQTTWQVTDIVSSNES